MNEAGTGTRYRWERVGNHELPVIRRGPSDGPVIILVQPLFEEHNRCRRLFADLGRVLAETGVASALPDLPRTGDHADLEPFDLELAKEALSAFAATETGAVHVVSLRGGALLVPPGRRHLALAPVTDGQRLLTDLIRTQAVATREAGGTVMGREDAQAEWADGNHVHLAGYDITPATAAVLSRPMASEPDLILTIGRNAALAGPPIWRQADPESTRNLSIHVADHILEWLQT